MSTTESSAQSWQPQVIPLRPLLTMSPKIRSPTSFYGSDYDALLKARRQSKLLLVALAATITLFLTFLWNSDSHTGRPVFKKAVAVMNGPSVEGTIYFTQETPTTPVRISGILKNVSPNSDRGFHIHELGDATNGCLSSGSHFNPEGKLHGSPLDTHRHVGDLGNVHSDTNGIVNLDIFDKKISLNGPHSIIGRSVVIFKGTDDLGKGGNEDSKKTGNAGGRAGCAVIGVAAS
ncbi:hypothetical protein M422DRAFT_24651 [Sphaerobolus stellatus SS14]|nr:hypothetical protein M422DRAFT_24651 [Sphaerobolus stellatus SS14]